MKDSWNNFRKTVCEVADGVLRKKVNNAARNISKKPLCLIERRRDLYKCYIRDGSYENIRPIKKKWRKHYNKK